MVSVNIPSFFWGTGLASTCSSDEGKEPASTGLCAVYGVGTQGYGQLPGSKAG